MDEIWPRRARPLRTRHVHSDERRPLRTGELGTLLADAAGREERGHAIPARDLAAVDPCQLRPDASTLDSTRDDRLLRAAVELGARHVPRHGPECTPAETRELATRAGSTRVRAADRVAAKCPADALGRACGVLQVRDREHGRWRRVGDGRQQRDGAAEEKECAHALRGSTPPETELVTRPARRAGATTRPSTIPACH